MKILVITGGTLKEEFLKSFLDGHSFDETIVVDGALKMAAGLGISFQSLVGDFDTVTPQELEPFLKRKGLYIERHRPQKNETDTELAVNLAVEKMKHAVRGQKRQDGEDAIAILGATGGRLDHMLGNIHLVYKALMEGVFCQLYDEDNCLFMVNDSRVLGEEAGRYRYVSFLPFTDRAEGVTLEGFLYPLREACLEKGSTLGISNEICWEAPRVSVRKGVLIGILSRDSMPTARREAPVLVGKESNVTDGSQYDKINCQ